MWKSYKKLSYKKIKYKILALSLKSNTKNEIRIHGGTLKALCQIISQTQKDK